MPWQQQAVDVALEVDADGIPYYREIVCTVMRQNGKSTMTAALMAHRAALWHPQPQRIIYSAQDGSSARKKLIEDIAPVYQRSKSIGKLIDKVLRGVGYEGVIFATGTRIDVLASSESAGHGRTIDLAVIDESFADVDDRREQAIQPAMATRIDAQVLNVSTAGTAASVFLHRKIDAGRQAVNDNVDRGICYLEWSIPDDEDIDDPEVWWRYMPALGWTITEDVIKHARRSMSDADFRRSFCNQWTSASERVIPDAVWRRVVGKASPDGRLVFFVEVARDRSMGSIAAADERGHVELVDYRPGVSWLPGRLAELVAKWSAPVRLDAGGPAGYLAAEVPDVDPLNGREMLQATAWFYDQVADGALSVREHPALESAVAAAARKVVGDSWAWARQSNDVDVSPLVAITGAAWCARPRDDDGARSGGFVDLSDYLNVEG